MAKIGECSVCFREFELSEDGLLTRHNDDRTGGVCSGVGYDPIDPVKTVPEKQNFTSYGFKSSGLGNEGFEKW